MFAPATHPQQNRVLFFSERKKNVFYICARLTNSSLNFSNGINLTGIVFFANILKISRV